MKQIVKKIVPISILNGVRKFLNKFYLSRINNFSFDTSNLLHQNSFNLSNIFCNPEIKKFWEQDNLQISNYYNYENLSGGVNPGDRRALYYMVMFFKPYKILEVGTHIGASTIYLAHALKRLNVGGKISTVDLLEVNHPYEGAWKASGLSSSPQKIMRETDCSNYVNFFSSSSIDFMKQTNEKYDLIFLDGDHSAQTVYKEISLALAILNTGGLIIIHDYFPNSLPLFPDRNVIQGPFLALERIMMENNNIKIQSLGELPWLTKQNSQNTSLAIISKKT